MKIKMVVTDLDGTLMNTGQEISTQDIETLRVLASRKIIRVIATGRSLYSANKVLDANLPIDYLIFSSGAGIQSWPDKKIINEHHLPEDQVTRIKDYFIDQQVDFMVHKTIPENHHFFYHQTSHLNADFDRRIAIYQPFAAPLMTSTALKKACQFVAIIPDHVISFEQICHDLPELTVIRTTSPLDKQTLWIEIFPGHVSKGQAADWLCRQHQIDHSQVVSLGNDYNDLDLLQWSGYSYVVEDAPQKLKEQFRVIAGGLDSPFSMAVSDALASMPK
jgi:Cof subfamily protein (haloacid dehalogenase superfamily)